MCAFFSSAKLNDKERESLAKNLSVKRYSDGAKMIVEGEAIREFFIIKEGQVRVTKHNPETQQSIEISRLKSGDYFGETAIQHRNDYQRGATISALGSCVCYSIEIVTFRQMFGDKLNVNVSKRTAVSAEAYNPDSKQTGSMVPPDADRSKTDEQRQSILAAIRSSMLFSQLSSDQQNQVVDEMWLRPVPQGQSIITQGDNGDFFYVVESGQFDIFVTGKDGVTAKVASRGPGSSFGELALMYNSPRAATVTALAQAAVWAVDRWTFRRVVAQISDQVLREYERLLGQVPSFGQFLSRAIFFIIIAVNCTHTTLYFRFVGHRCLGAARARQARRSFGGGRVRRWYRYHQARRARRFLLYPEEGYRQVHHPQGWPSAASRQVSAV